MVTHLRPRKPQVRFRPAPLLRVDSRRRARSKFRTREISSFSRSAGPAPRRVPAATERIRPGHPSAPLAHTSTLLACAEHTWQAEEVPRDGFTRHRRLKKNEIWWGNPRHYVTPNDFFVSLLEGDPNLAPTRQPVFFSNPLRNLHSAERHRRSLSP